MGMHLTTNNFARVFINDWESFNYTIESKPDNGTGRMLIKWNYKRYEGFGYIDVKDYKLCKGWNNNFSYLTIASWCNVDFKPSDGLWNDSDLEYVFDKIINSAYKKIE